MTAAAMKATRIVLAITVPCLMRSRAALALISFLISRLLVHKPKPGIKGGRPLSSVLSQPDTTVRVTPLDIGRWTPLDIGLTICQLGHLRQLPLLIKLGVVSNAQVDVITTIPQTLD